ncbi:hypothetical protein ACFO3K_09755 [Cellulomonas algicola]|uniref:Polysaccharide biosynthesis protein n=1 Tax=Cellulomonas algicola TaxID=2071633 RepID=A0A401V553_9CELL|nr:hypothetical protein [Cellulomonas algicola]GCD22045.1 hypothetical protein CTKZ_36070 [Cellulomonas algicola]
MSARRPRADGIGTIGAAIAVASAAGWLLQLVVGRQLGPAQYGEFIAFWGVVFGIGGSLSTLEQEVARRAARSELVQTPSTGSVAVVAALLAGAVGALTLVPAVADRVYGGSATVFGTIVVLTSVGFAAQFAVRGYLVGTARTRSYGLIVVAEAALRLVVLLLVLVAGVLDLTTAALAVGVGSFAWLAWPRATATVLGSARTLPTDLRAAGGRAVSLLGGGALTAAVITGFPTLVTALTGEAPGAAGGALFAALTVSRLPLLLVSPVQAVAVPRVARWRADLDEGRPSPAGRVVVLGTVAAVGVAALGGVVGALIGPWLVQLLYDESYVVSPAAVGVLVASACLLAWLLLLSAALIALSAHRTMVATWLSATGATCVWLLVSPWPLVPTTVAGALVGPVVGLVVALPAVRARLRPAPVSSPATS